jgi:hypothetical protein
VKGIGNPHGYPDYTWPMVWVLQDGELWPIEQWVAHQGQEKLWSVTALVNASQTVDRLLYTVPAGKVIYLANYCFGGAVKGSHVLLYTAPDVLLKYFSLSAYASIDGGMRPPVVIPAGKNIYVRFSNADTTANTMHAALQAYELDV